MRNRLARILSLLCVLALAMGCLISGAVAEETQMESRIVIVEWKDGDNYDGIRPASVSVSLAGQSLTLSEANSWAGEVTVPKGTGNEWSFTAPDKYTATVKAGDITVITFHHAAGATAAVSASVVWSDDDNAAKIRPESVQLYLLADGAPCGEPITVKAPAWTATWGDLMRFRVNSTDEVVYTVGQVQTPAGYSSSASGLTVTNTIQKGTLSLSFSAVVPEGADPSGLTVTVDGPDPSMPQTLTYAQLAAGSYSFGSVLPGAYLVRGTNALDLLEGYVMDGEKSKISDAVYVKAGEAAALSYQMTWKAVEAAEMEEGYDPLANIGSLTFEILGPDPRMPITLTYAQFTDGKYQLSDLAPGVYTVVERNAETLVKYYTLTSASVTGLAITVEADTTVTAILYNQYAPAPTPEPDAEFVDIPVTKTWNDNNNQDGNRPESITVRLYADGVEVDSHVLTAAEGWTFTFVDKPRYQDDHRTEIVYTVNEDAVAMYTVEINGYNIVNNYNPEVTSVSVAKIWKDDDNVQGIRPTSIAMTLNDGQKDVAVVVLNAANGWQATVNNLPTVVNGQPAKYAWKEQEVLGYALEGVVQEGNLMTFTNAVWVRPQKPTAGKPPKVPGETFYVFEDYDTPLGVEVIINHVGDCFD